MTNIIEIPPLDYQPDPRGVGYFYYDNLLKHCDKIGQLDGITGKTDTYGELLKRSVQTAIFLQRHNVQKNDFISICTYNHFDSCTPLIASFLINAVTSAVDPTLSSSDVIFLLKQTKPKVIFAALDAVNTIETVIDNLGYAMTVVVFGETQKYIAFSDILDSYGEEIENFRPSTAKSLREIALICFSSGTSGLPKPAAHSHYGLMYSYANNVHSGYNFGLLFGFYSPYWTLFSHGLGTCVSQGTTRLILPKFDASNPWEPFRHEVTTAVLNVFQAIKLLSVEKPEGLNTSSLSTLVLTGGIISNDQLLKVKDLFPGTLVCNVYGQSEVAGYLTQFRLSSLSDLEIFAKKFGSVGTGLPGSSYKIVDLESEMVVGPYQKGELRVKSQSQLSCYYGMEGVDVYDAEGWLRTGDVGYYDEEFCFYIVERLKEMFKCRGFHVVPAMLEALLLQYLPIAMAVVIGIRHKIDGHWPAAIIVLKPEYGNVTIDNIHDFFNSRVQDRERLRGGLKVVNSFPLTASGKIHRRKIKELYTKELENMLM